MIPSNQRFGCLPLQLRVVTKGLFQKCRPHMKDVHLRMDFSLLFSFNLFDDLLATAWRYVSFRTRLTRPI